MKFLSKTLFVFVLSVFLSTDFVWARTVTSSSKSNRSEPVSRLSRDYPDYYRAQLEKYEESLETPTEYTQSDCTTKYMEALDKECYNANNVSEGGVYADCNDNTMTEYFDIMDMQLANIVSLSNFREYKENCEQYKGNALTQWLSAKTIVEEAAIKGSSECVLANKRLTAAKKCYSAAIAHDGNSFEFEDLMMLTCGDFPDIAYQFSEAGDLGLANIPQLIENYSTFQFTNKSENWRQAVEAILAGYTYDAKQSCGEETYELLQLNDFTSDNRENLLTLTADSFASEFGSNLGSRAYNAITPSSNSSPAYQGVYNGIQSSPYSTTKNSTSDKEEEEEITPVSVNEIYVIDNVSSVNNTRARLLNIMITGDVGTSDTQDDIDRAIIMALGGRIGITDTIIYNTISSISSGDSFIIKQTDGTCQVLMMDDNGNFIKLSSASVSSNKTLSTYTYDCKRVIE